MTGVAEMAIPQVQHGSIYMLVLLSVTLNSYPANDVGMSFIQYSVLNAEGNKPMTDNEIKALLIQLFEVAGMPVGKKASLSPFVAIRSPGLKLPNHLAILLRLRSQLSLYLWTKPHSAPPNK